MSIDVYHTYLKNGTLKEGSGHYPCFGATGRVDWNGCNPKLLRDIQEFSGEHGLIGPSSSSSRSDIPWVREDIQTIRLKSDSFPRFFHISNRKFLDYLVHRSPWAPLFIDSAEKIYHQNYVDLRVDVLPSEAQTWLHIQIRDGITRSTFGLTFDTLVAGGISEDFAFGLSLLLPYLGINNTDNRFGNEGICAEFNLKWFLNPDFDTLPLFPHTMKEVHGYIMNITHMFSSSTDTEDIIEDLIEKHSEVTKVSGLFIRKNMRIINPIKLANAIKEAL